MKITKRQLRRIIKEETAKYTDITQARDAARPRDPIGVVEATALIKSLEDMGYAIRRRAVTELSEFLQSLENDGYIKHGGWD